MGNNCNGNDCISNSVVSLNTGRSLFAAPQQPFVGLPLNKYIRWDCHSRRQFKNAHVCISTVYGLSVEFAMTKDTFLGEGGHGVTFKCEIATFESESDLREYFGTSITTDTQAHNARECAVKLIDADSSEDAIVDYTGEFNAQLTVGYPSILGPMGMFQIGNKDYYPIVMERLVNIVTAEQYLLQIKDTQQLIKACQLLFADMKQQLFQLHSVHKYLHKDAHTGNIVLNTDTGHFALVDFGLAQPIGKVITQRGTYYFKSPQLSRHKWKTDEQRVIANQPMFKCAELIDFYTFTVSVLTRFMGMPTAKPQHPLWMGSNFDDAQMESNLHFLNGIKDANETKLPIQVRKLAEPYVFFNGDVETDIKQCTLFKT